MLDISRAEPSGSVFWLETHVILQYTVIVMEYLLINVSQKGEALHE